MWGAIIGDLAGSIYEFEQIKEIKSIRTTVYIKHYLMVVTQIQMLALLVRWQKRFTELIPN